MSDQERKRGWNLQHTKDARGRSVRLLDPYVLHLTRQHTTIPADILQKITEELPTGVECFPKWVARFMITLWILAVLVYVIFCVDLVVNNQLGSLLGTPGIMMSTLCILPAVPLV